MNRQCGTGTYPNHTLPETNSSHLKIDGWKTSLSFWKNPGIRTYLPDLVVCSNNSEQLGYHVFRDELLVSGRVTPEFSPQWRVKKLGTKRWMIIFLKQPTLFSDVFTEDMGVSKNSGTPKSSILIGFSIINHPFWGIPIFGNTHILPLPPGLNFRYLYRSYAFPPCFPNPIAQKNSWFFHMND